MRPPWKQLLQDAAKVVQCCEGLVPSRCSANTVIKEDGTGVCMCVCARACVCVCVCVCV